MTAGYKIFLIGDIRTIITGVHKRRRTYPYMDFNRTCISQHIYLICDRIASDDRIIDDDYTLAFDNSGDGIELNLYRLLPLFLGRLDKSPSHIGILNKALLIRDARLRRETQRGIYSGLRDADDYVAVTRVSARKYPSGFPSCLGNGYAVDDRIRSCKIYIFENAFLHAASDPGRRRPQ